jgi:hypothetical protein
MHDNLLSLEVEQKLKHEFQGCLFAIWITYSLLVSFPVHNQNGTHELELAAHYLYQNYNSKLRLIHEAPIVAPNIYWLVSDNLLAQEALRGYFPQTSSEIKERLIDLADEFGLPRNDEGLPISFKHEVLLGENTSLPFRTSTIVTLINTSDYVVRAEIANGTIMHDWADYADLLLFASLSEFNLWNRTRNEAHLNMSRKWFERAAGMWDGIGLRDKTVIYGQYERGYDIYATYKLALLYHVSKLLNETLTYENELLERLWKQQQANGGFFTDYLSDGSPYGDTNTETTAIVLIANVKEKAEAPLGWLETLIIVNTMLTVANLILLVAIMRMIRRK